jgi:hypothetical protein
MIKNYHIITLKNLPATNTLEYRLKLRSARYNSDITLKRDDIHDNPTEQAIDYLKGKGFNIIAKAELGVCGVGIITTTFKPL